MVIGRPGADGQRNVESLILRTNSGHEEIIRFLPLAASSAPNIRAPSAAAISPDHRWTASSRFCTRSIRRSEQRQPHPARGTKRGPEKRSRSFPSRLTRVRARQERKNEPNCTGDGRVRLHSGTAKDIAGERHGMGGGPRWHDGLGASVL